MSVGDGFLRQLVLRKYNRFIHCCYQTSTILDFVLLAADYSQLELRMMAHSSRDEALLCVFKNGRDLFRELAAEVYDKKHRIDDVTEEERKVAKEIVYG